MDHIERRLRYLDTVCQHTGMTPEEFDRLHPVCQTRLLDIAADDPQQFKYRDLGVLCQAPADPSCDAYVMVTFRDDATDAYVSLPVEKFWQRFPAHMPINRKKQRTPGNQLELPL